MSLTLFNHVPVGAIEVLVDCDKQPWFKRAYVGKFLDIKHIATSLEGLEKQETRVRSGFKPTISASNSSSGPKDQQNKADVFLSKRGVCT